MANLSTYTQIVSAEVDDTSARAQTVIERALKDTYQEILRHCGKYLISSEVYSEIAVSGTKQYTPTEFYEVLKVLWHDDGDTDFVELTPITQETFLEKHYNIDNGTPSMYYQNGLSLDLVATPDNAGTLNVIYVPAQAELGTSSVVPDRYTNVIVLGAIARFKMYEGVPEATDYQAKYGASLQDMKKELMTQFEIVKPSFMGR